MASSLVWPEPGRPLGLVPGLRTTHADGSPDVLRGEEVQIFGALDALGLDHGIFVLPGTHSKWAIVESRRVMGFCTFMTGELYALLRHQSILSRLMTVRTHGLRISKASWQAAARPPVGRCCTACS